MILIYMLLRKVLLVIGLLILLCVVIGVCRVQFSFGEQFAVPSVPGAAIPKETQEWIGEYVLENTSPPTIVAVALSLEGNGTIKAGGMTWGFGVRGVTAQLLGDNACSVITVAKTGAKDPVSGLDLVSANITQQTGAAPISLSQFIANGGCLLPTQPMPTWLVNNAGQIYKGTADYSKWVSIPGQLTTVKLNADYVVGINNAGNVFQCKRPCSGSWQQICSGSMAALDIDQPTGSGGSSGGGGAGNYNIWGVSSAGQVMFTPLGGSLCGTWTQVPTPNITPKLIAVNSLAVYITDANTNQIYFCPKPVSNTTPNWTGINGWASSMSASDSQVWTIGGGNIIYVASVNSDGSLGAWAQVQNTTGDPFVNIAGTGSDYVWGIGQSQHIYQCPQPCESGQWTEVHGLASQIASLR